MFLGVMKNGWVKLLIILLSINFLKNLYLFIMGRYFPSTFMRINKFIKNYSINYYFNVSAVLLFLLYIIYFSLINFI